MSNHRKATHKTCVVKICVKREDSQPVSGSTCRPWYLPSLGQDPEESSLFWNHLQAFVKSIRAKAAPQEHLAQAGPGHAEVRALSKPMYVPARYWEALREGHLVHLLSFCCDDTATDEGTAQLLQ